MTTEPTPLAAVSAAAPDPGPEPEYVIHATDDTPMGNYDDTVEWAFDKGVEYGTWRERKRVFDASQSHAAAAPAYEVVLDRSTGEVTRQAAAAPDEREARERLARAEANAEIEGEPLTDSERASILAGRCGPLLYGGPCWLLPGHRTPAHLCYREDADALIAAALAARPAPVVSGEDVDALTNLVAALQRLCDDEWLRRRDRMMRLHGARPLRDSGASEIEYAAYSVRRLIESLPGYDPIGSGGAFLAWMRNGRDEGVTVADAPAAEEGER